jgi:hypothetical protein
MKFRFKRFLMNAVACVAIPVLFVLGYGLLLKDKIVEKLNGKARD